MLGFAGNDDKLKWLKNELGFDEVFNYKNVNTFKTLKEHAPKGVNCYFDNVRKYKLRDSHFFAKEKVHVQIYM